MSRSRSTSRATTGACSDLALSVVPDRALQPVHEPARPLRPRRDARRAARHRARRAHLHQVEGRGGRFPGRCPGAPSFPPRGGPVPRRAPGGGGGAHPRHPGGGAAPPPKGGESPALRPAGGGGGRGGGGRPRWGRRGKDLGALVAIRWVSALGFPEETRPALLEAHDAIVEPAARRGRRAARLARACRTPLR